MNTRMQIVIEVDFDEPPARPFFNACVLDMTTVLEIGRIVYVATEQLNVKQTLKGEER